MDSSQCPCSKHVAPLLCGLKIPHFIKNRSIRSDLETTVLGQEHQTPHAVIARSGNGSDTNSVFEICSSVLCNLANAIWRQTEVSHPESIYYTRGVQCDRVPEPFFGCYLLW